MSDLIFDLQPRFEGLAPRETADHPAVQCPAALLHPLVEVLRNEYGYTLLMDIAGVDWEDASPRFSVVYHLYSLKTHAYLRIAVDCENNENPSVPSIVSLFPGADWHERETYDMFGIRFEGHPDLRRILMWDGYPYYPLRKEFPLAGIETELPDDEIGEETKAKVIAAPIMGGPFVAKTGESMRHSEPRAADESWTEGRPKPGNEG